MLYESPHRLLKLLNELGKNIHPERKVSISRELTKKFEETTIGTIEKLLKKYNHQKPKGEFVVVVQGKN